ncbi:MAG: 3-keto-disaccharide hydrolase, partial [Roseimicrobium sp.]
EALVCIGHFRILPWAAIVSAVAVVALLVALWASQQGSQSAWQPLFNGKDLEGWQVRTDNWSVSDGYIRSVPGSSSRTTLDTVEKFADVILEAEFALGSSKATSGIYLPNDFQIDIGPSSGAMWISPRLGVAAPPPLAMVRDPGPGTWHQCRAVVRAGRITVEIDGTVTTDFEDSRAAEKPLEGFIRLEHSGMEKAEGVWFRNLRVQRL